MQITRSFMRKHTNRKKVRNKMKEKLRKQAAKLRSPANRWNAIVQFNHTAQGAPIQLPDGSIASVISPATLKTASTLGDVAWDGEIVRLPGASNDVIKAYMQPHFAYLVNLGRRSIEQVGLCQQDSAIGALVYGDRVKALDKLKDTGDYASNPTSGWAHFIVSRATAHKMVQLYRETSTKLDKDLANDPLCTRSRFWPSE